MRSGAGVLGTVACSTGSGSPPQRFVPFDWGHVDVDRFSPEVNPVSFTDRDDVMVVGSFRRARGRASLPSYQIFLEAVGRLSERRRDFQVVIGGLYDDGESEQVRSLIDRHVERYGLEDHVTTLSMIPKEEMPGHYAGLDVYVNFSHKGLRLEAIGTAAKEAMASGCALVTFDDPSPRYVVDELDSAVDQYR